MEKNIQIEQLCYMKMAFPYDFTGKFNAMDKRALMKHPISSWTQDESLGKRFVVLCDDTDDRPYSPSCYDRHEYVSWHSLVLSDSSIIPITDQWLAVKRNLGITTLSCKNSNKLLIETDLANVIHDLLRSYNVQHFFTFVRKPLFKKKGRFGSDYKDDCLRSHLMCLDKHLKGMNLAECYAFCDRTSGSKFRNVVEGGRWGYRTLQPLTSINPRVAFKTSNSSHDDISVCLDLVDYAAWSVRFTLEKLLGRCITKGDISMKDAIIKSTELSRGEQNICELVGEDLKSMRIFLLDEWGSVEEPGV